MRVVVAEGELLERISGATFSHRNRGLTRPAAATLDAALRKTAWAPAHHQRVALVDGSDVLACADRYAFSGTIDGTAVSICGIGAIRPGPVHRHDRQARQLVDHLIDDARDTGAGAVLLCLMPHERDYIPEGFGELPTHDLVLKVIESPRYGAPMTPLRVGEDRDLAAIVAMGEIRAMPFAFHLDRSVDYVKYAITRARLRAGLAPSGDRQLRFIIAEEGITAAAYVVVTVAGTAWTIEECGDRDPSGARVGAILQALVAEEPAERRPAIRAWLPPGFLPPQVTRVSTHPSAEVLALRVLVPGLATQRLFDDAPLYWRVDLF
jgi:hypothetical protein